MAEQIYQEIKSPLSLFNNFMVTIGEQLSEIYEYDLFKNNDIIFDDDSILLFGYIKLTKNDKKNQIQLLIKKPITDNNYIQVKTTINNFKKLSDIYYRFMILFLDISNKIDISVTTGYINSIINDLTNNSFENKIYFIPHRNKIANDIKDNSTLKNLYDKFGYGLSFTVVNSNKFKYSIIRMISSDLNESKSIINIRPLEIDTVITGNVTKANIPTFLNDLMFYGNLTNVKSTNI